MGDVERDWRSPGDKHVCADCFSDYAIKDFIGNNLVADECDYCGRQDEEPVAAHIDDVFELMDQGLRTEWGRSSAGSGSACSSS